MKTITAQDLYNFTKCHHRVYLDANGNPDEKGEVGAFIKLLWELGLQTERDYIASLGTMAVVDLQSLSVETASSETLELMKQGIPLIYQGCIQDGPYVGRPDLLIKREDSTSRFGPYLYDPVDIKAGRGWERQEGKKPRFKEHYAFQILFYRMVLTRIQDAIPRMARIINIDKEIEEFDPTVFEPAFEAALGQTNRLIAGHDSSEPVLGSHCYLCGWFQRCRRWVADHDDPTGLFFVGKQKFQLKEVGLRTIQDIAIMDVQTHLHPPKKIHRMGEKSLRRMKERAHVLLANKPVIRPGFSFPSVKREVYFDIEDDPTQNLTYLYGLLIHEANQPPRFTYFLARRPEEEESTVRAFWEFLANAQDDAYYVYSHKERATLKHLMERYHLDQEVFQHYVNREYDLYKDLIVEYSDWPTFSYGIKHIAKLIGFSWRDTDPSGANSIAWYNDYLAHPQNEHLLNRILVYNEDDCRAMVAIKDYFEKMRSSAYDT
ncbi:MAG: TM0106 family RecB-like putative nuclease [Nitrospirales bacterium]|nr:TM0106 family RecB-like putative nuclease [Nitrospirales bacterium]